MADSIASILVHLGVDARDFQRNIDAVAGVLDNLGDRFTRAGAYLTAGLTAPLAALGVAAVRSTSDIEALKAGLTAIVGSAKEANAAFERIKGIAKLPGLGLEEATQGLIQLKTAGLSMDGAERALKAFGNAIAMTGGGKAQLAGVIVQLQQMANAPTVMAGDLRPIITQVPMAAKVLRDLYGTISAGGIRDKGITPRQLIEDLIGGLEKLDKVDPTTYKNTFENFSDTIKLALQPLGEAMKPGVMAVLSTAASAIKTLAEAFAALPPGVQATLIGIGTGLAAIGPALIVIGGAANGASAVLGLFTSLGKTSLGTAGVEGLIAAASAIRGMAILPFTAIVEGVTAIGTAFGLAGAAATAGGTLVAAAVIGTIAYVATHWDSYSALVVGFWTDLWNNAQSIFGGMAEWIGSIWNSVTGAWSAAWSAISGALAPIFGPIVTWLGGLWDGVVTRFGQVWEGARNFLVGIWQSIAKFAGEIWGWIVTKVSWAVNQLAKLFPETAKALKTGDWSISMPSFGGESAGKPSTGVAPPLTGPMFANVQVPPISPSTIESYSTFGKATRDLSGDFAVHIEMFKLQKKAVDDSEKSIAKLKLQLEQGLKPSLIDINELLAYNPLSELDISKIAVPGPMDANARVIEAMKGVVIPPSVDEAFRRAGLRHKETSEQLIRDYEMVAAAGAMSAQDQIAWLDKIINAQTAEGKVIGDNLARQVTLADAMRESQTANLQFWQGIKNAIDNLFSSLSSGIASSIVQWRGGFEAIKNSFQGFAEDLLKTFLDRLLAPLKDAFMNAFLGEGGILSGITGGLTRGLSSLLGGGTKVVDGAEAFGDVAKAGSSAVDAALGVGGAAASSVGAAAKGASSAAGMASGLMGVLNPVGAIGAAVGAVSSVISNFQMAGMNKSLDIIVKHTLQMVMIGEATFGLIHERLVAIIASLEQVKTDYLLKLYDINDNLESIRLRGESGGDGLDPNAPRPVFFIFDDADRDRVMRWLAEGVSIA